MSFFDFPPRIHPSKLPEIEQDHANHIGILLHSLGSRCDDFEGAVKLLEYAMSQEHRGKPFEESQKFFRWMFIAARDASSTIYKFFEDMEFIGHNLNPCPTLRSMIDLKAKKAATKKFSQHFPGFAGVRHSAHHYAKLYGSPEGIREHIAPGRIVAVNNMFGTTLQTTFEKKTVELDISDASLAKLKEVRDLYWSAFTPLDPGHARMVESFKQFSRDSTKRK